jgi:hypothetical protein
LGVKAAFAGSCRSTKTDAIRTKAVMNSLPTASRPQALQALSQCRRELYASLTRRADELTRESVGEWAGGSIRRSRVHASE